MTKCPILRGWAWSVRPRRPAQLFTPAMLDSHWSTPTGVSAMKLCALIMVAVLAFAGSAHAQVKKITPRGVGGFGSGASAPTPETPDGRKEGPEQNRSFQKFLS